MAAVEVDMANVREFADADAFYTWLSHNHATVDEVWIKIHKVNSGRNTPSPIG